MKMNVFGRELNEKVPRFENKTFRSAGRKVLLKNCPANLEAFVQLGWNEELVIEKAINNIFHSFLSASFRQNEGLTELEFKLPEIKQKKTKTIELSKLTEEQKKALMNMGLL